MKKIGWFFVFALCFSFLTARAIPQKQNLQNELQESEIQLLDFEDSGEPDFKGDNV